MEQDKQNCKDEDRINALTFQDWEPLLILIPEIEKQAELGIWSIKTTGKGGNFLFQNDAPAIVFKFSEVVYGIPVIIGFDWSSWEEGRKMTSDETFDFDSVDLVTKCKLITAIVRNDRFCEGALVSAFKSGLILEILKSIEKTVRNQC